MSAQTCPWGIDKNILLSVLLVTFFAGCDAGEKIQDVVDDTKDFNNNDKKMVTDGIEGDLTQDIKESLLRHNEARLELGIDTNLTWSDTISRDAQLYADEMAQSGYWGHDKKNQIDGYAHGNYGENLYTSSNAASIEIATQAWIDEKEYYTYGKVVSSSAVDDTCVDGVDIHGNAILCGHYTQIIWKDTTLVGCAMSRYEVGDYKGWDIVVCKYQTPGNVIGETPY